MHTQKVPVCWLISSAALNFGYILNLVIQLKFISQNSFNFNLSIITLSNISLTGLIFKEVSCKRSGEQGTYPNRRKCQVKKMPQSIHQAPKSKHSCPSTSYNLQPLSLATATDLHICPPTKNQPSMCFLSQPP